MRSMEADDDRGPDVKIVRAVDVERRLLKEHAKALYEWQRQVVQLGTGALTLLVTLQQQYVPASPRWLPVLAASWVLLLLSVATGVFALRAESATLLDLANDVYARRRQGGEILASAHLEMAQGRAPRRVFAMARTCMGWCLVLGLLAFATFAIANLWK